MRHLRDVGHRVDHSENVLGDLAAMSVHEDRLQDRRLVEMHLLRDAEAGHTYALHQLESLIGSADERDLQGIEDARESAKNEEVHELASLGLGYTDQETENAPAAATAGA